MSEWQRLAEEHWTYQLNQTFTLSLEGLGLYLSPVSPDSVVDYRFSPMEQWLELGFEWNLHRGDSQHLNMEVNLLGTLAAGDCISLRIGGTEWEVAPFPPELLED
ncbi:MAG: hypothetical protein Q4C89_00005 [Deinococcus sp.]|uniref:hypothetical protein n=1 Tax=Deinococcus sp. TaxID=47478 RepID=UPI0026DAE647|nr:hypothetical protein [Deinococcus sp.]MDO4244391.1 hypothetical protein [Deinococcus sp.]